MKDNILEERTIDLTKFFKKLYFDVSNGNWIYEADLDILESLSKFEYENYTQLNFLRIQPIKKETFKNRIKLIKEEIERRKKIN